MTWLIGWLLFGLLAVRELAGLASTEDRGLPIALCLAFGLLGAAALGRLCVRSVKRGRPGALYQLCALCLVGLAAIAWRTHGGPADEREFVALIATSAYLALSLAAGTISVVLSWRVRRRRRKLRREQQTRGEHRDRLDRVGMPISPELAAMGLRPEDDPWPARLDPEELLGDDGDIPPGNLPPAPQDRPAARWSRLPQGGRAEPATQQR